MEMLIVGSNGLFIIFDFVENFRLFEEQVEKFKNLYIDFVEFCCFKVIIFFNLGKWIKCFLFILEYKRFMFLDVEFFYYIV